MGPIQRCGKMGDWVFVVVYGYPTSRMCPLNQALHKEVADWVAGQGNARVVIGGDWQVPPEDISPDGGKTPLGHVLDPGEPTCITREGNRQTVIDYFIVNDAARHEVHSWGVRDGAQATHRTATIELKGEIRPTVRALWEAKAIPDPFIGPIRAMPEGTLTEFPGRDAVAADLESAVLAWANAATERLLLRGGVPPGHWRTYLGRGEVPRTLLKQAFSKRPEGAADVPGRRALRVLRNRLRALKGAVDTPKWRWDFAVNTRLRVKCMGAYGMEPEDADRWRDRTLDVDSASKQDLDGYIAELDARLKVMEAQHRKDRLHAFRERVRMAVR